VFLLKSKMITLRDIKDRFKHSSLEALFSNDFLRERALIPFVDKKIHAELLKDETIPMQVRKDQYYIGRALISVVNNAYKRAENSPSVQGALLHSFIENIEFNKKRRSSNKPSFLVIAPGKFCNLNCFGCYANSKLSNSEKLDFETLDRIVDEKTKLWSSYFTVITGGEPTLYKSQGKTIFDLAEKHQDNFFLMYTNGTLIDKKMAERFADVGNITPAISVEGFEEHTDARRGKGVHKKILEAMKNLKEEGVFYGISITATKNNADWILNDETFDYYFDTHGALYAWIFQYMPIGRSNSLELMVNPEQRVKMFRQNQSLVKDKKLFVADFWNSGALANGCISAGRKGGYLYIDWKGDVSPCAFNPYTPVNIYNIYAKGGNLDDVLKEPFFEAIRQWQKDYYTEQPADKKGNIIMTCPIKDHYEMLRPIIDEQIAKHNLKPMDEAAAEALEDPEYKKGMVEYHKGMCKATDNIWRDKYLKNNHPLKKRSKIALLQNKIV